MPLPRFIGRQPLAFARRLDSRLFGGSEVGIPHDTKYAPRSIRLLPPNGYNLARVLERRFSARGHRRHFVRAPRIGKVTLSLDLNDALLERGELGECAKEALNR